MAAAPAPQMGSHRSCHAAVRKRPKQLTLPRHALPHPAAGVNNLSEHTPLPRLERMMGELLDWMSAAMPHTRLLLLGLTPTTAHDTRAANRRYRRLARERGIPFVRCGAGIDPSDASLILDGTHPTEAGGNIIVRCLGPAVRELLEEGAA